MMTICFLSGCKKSLFLVFCIIAGHGNRQIPNLQQKLCQTRQNFLLSRKMMKNFDRGKLSK